MSRTRIAALTALLCLGASAAQAQSAYKDGWYLGADLGQSKLERDDFIGVTSQDNTSDTYALLVGYRFSRYFSLEGGYVDMGDFHSTFLPGCPSCVEEKAHTSIDAFFANAVGTWPIAEHFQLRGILGFTHRDLKISTESPQFSSSWSESGSSFSYGIGVGVPVNERFEIDLNYMRYTEIGLGLTLNSDVGLFSESEAAVTSLGLRFHF